MKLEVPVSYVMTKNLVLLHTTDSLEKAEYLMKKHQIRHIPVVDNKKIVGILSQTDLLRLSFADSYNSAKNESELDVYNMLTVNQIMMKNLTCVSSGTSIYKVAKLLKEHEFHALPVVDHNELVGIVTTTDLITYLLAHYENEPLNN